MAAHPKITDNEMNYFQFKARQMLLLKKEDREWQEFCKQVAPECVACGAEKVEEKEFKDIGIQANSRINVKRFEKPVLQSKKQNEELPETLNNIKSRLENIDLALSKIYNIPDEKEKRKNHGETSTVKSMESVKLLEEERRHFIQSSLKTSIEKLQFFPHKITKKLETKPKSSGYFLPYDLQVKRVAARKAYLASLQNKPKVSFQKERQITKNNTQSAQNIKSVSKHPPKPRKIIVPKKPTKSSNENETLVASVKIDETEDENIEYVVDAILEDLLQEAGLDLNKIRERKREFNNTFKQKTLANKVSFTNIPSKMLTSSSIINTQPQTSAYGDNSSITKLNLFSNFSTKINEEDKQTELLIKGTQRRSSDLHFAYQKHDPVKSTSKSEPSIFQTRSQFSRIKDAPKFVCDILHTITIDPEKAKDIIQNKERYSRYLKNISRTVKGNFNPWVLNSILAESILDDCINDIAEELSDVPSTFIQELYNQEFIQQVEK